MERGTDRLTRLARRLVTATLIYNVLEGVVSVWWGSRTESSALVAFGLDSGIEVAAGTVLLWRLRATDPDLTRSSERRAQRFIGLTFLALAAYVLIEAAIRFIQSDAPSVNVVGMVVAAASLIIMPLISVAKLRVARRLGSLALRGEALETLACSYLSLTVLIGLAANAAFGWWWADPIAAVLMVPWLIKEGVEGIRGESCGAECGEQEPALRPDREA